MSSVDTIVAVATPPGMGGISVVRFSGPRCREIAARIIGIVPEPRYAYLAAFRNTQDEIIDEGIALYFDGPHSYTGEDVLELQGHGSPVVMDQLLQAGLALGARIARAGEFTERAFLNGKMDLAQAEAVADLIEAGSAAVARSALHSMQGVFSSQIRILLQKLIELRVYVEGAIDFPEEELDFLADENVAERMKDIQHNLVQIFARAEQGRLLHDGLTLALAGPPNAGKSSLLNALAGAETAIVSEIAGTTRDVLREQILIDGMPVRILDTAGLRDARDSIEQEGVRRAKAAMTQADRILLVVDDSSITEDDLKLLLEHLPADIPGSIVRNKIDVTGRSAGISSEHDRPVVYVSAHTGAGLDVLRQHLASEAHYERPGEGTFIARRRHLDALARAQRHVSSALKELQETRAGELVAEELRQAQRCLGEVTGEFSTDDLLGEIFSSFCIGK